MVVVQTVDMCAWLSSVSVGLRASGAQHTVLWSGVVLGCSQGLPDAELLVAPSSSQASFPPPLRCRGGPIAIGLRSTTASVPQKSPKKCNLSVKRLVVVVVVEKGRGGEVRGGGGEEEGYVCVCTCTCTCVCACVRVCESVCGGRGEGGGERLCVGGVVCMASRLVS